MKNIVMIENEHKVFPANIEPLTDPSYLTSSFSLLFLMILVGMFFLANLERVPKVIFYEFLMFLLILVPSIFLIIQNHITIGNKWLIYPLVGWLVVFIFNIFFTMKIKRVKIALFP